PATRPSRVTLTMVREAPERSLLRARPRSQISRLSSPHRNSDTVSPATMGRGARSSVNEDGLAGHQIAKTINSPSWLIHHSNEGIELPSLDAKLAFTEDHIL